MANPTPNGQEFLDLYNRLDSHLRKLTQSDGFCDFPAVLDKAAHISPPVFNRRQELLNYNKLRALIAHAPTPIAEPTSESLAAFRNLVDTITCPKSLISIASRNLEPFQPDQDLSIALSYMRQRDFSQVVVIATGELSLLTVEGITRWLGAWVQEGTLPISIAKIADALEYDDPNAFVTVSQRATIDDAYEEFATSIAKKRPRLFAIIITATGSRRASPLGLVTPWDLLPAVTTR